MKVKMMMLCLALMSWGAYAQNDHSKKSNEMNKNMTMFKDAKLGTAFEHYTKLKDALVSSKKDEVKKAAVELQKSLASVTNGRKAMDETAKMAAATNLADQRKAFAGLSSEIAVLVKGGQLSMGMIYLDYCPMVKASWLSNEKEIKNPYYGNEMLKCGSVKETIQ